MRGLVAAIAIGIGPGSSRAGPSERLSAGRPVGAVCRITPGSGADLFDAGSDEVVANE
jgi:hypothetical protein